MGTFQGNCRLTLSLLSSSVFAYLQVSLIDNSTSGFLSSFAIRNTNAAILHKISKTEKQKKSILWYKEMESWIWGYWQTVLPCKLHEEVGLYCTLPWDS